MKHLVTGIVAHVDAGKTTLSEALLYQAGAVRKLGRVDNGDAFLDSDQLERQRGITIFSHQAQLNFDQMQLTLLDTPGHVDFASQAEQVLSVLDYAILVVSATDGIQGYTRMLWQLLQRYEIPTFIFVNKMDAPTADREQVLTQLQTTFSTGCVPFSDSLTDEAYEAIAMCDDDVLAQYLESGEIADETVQSLILSRHVFPVYFGAALKTTGVDDLVSGLEKWTTERRVEDEFGAQIFKISHDDKGERLTWLRMTGGALHTKDQLFDYQKVNQIRLYNGTKFATVPEVVAGDVCAIPGLTDTFPGQGLGAQANALAPMMQPVLTYTLDPKGNDLQHCLKVLQQLGDEDPQLHVSWSKQLQEIRVQLMGQVQLEILQQLLKERFQLDVGFDQGSILYRETILSPVEGVGHFEPLRHYAEVHLLMTPTEPGSGLTFDADVHVDTLGKNWQHQVLSNLRAKTHLGVLTGAPITDMKITLINGRSHIKHTEGGDFREATWRAVRQGLMMQRAQGQCQLLEPWYRFRLTVPQDQVGRAMSDVQKMSGEVNLDDAGQQQDGFATLTGVAPVSEMQAYSQTVNAYTHGKGQLESIVDGYRPCHNADEVIAKASYEPEADLENTPDSVFCAHGAGYPVKWDEVPGMAHVKYRE